MTAIIGGLFTVLMLVLLAPVILVVWLFSLIWKLIKAIIKGIDNVWYGKQEEKYYRNYYNHNSNDYYRN